MVTPVEKRCHCAGGSAETLGLNGWGLCLCGGTSKVALLHPLPSRGERPDTGLPHAEQNPPLA